MKMYVMIVISVKLFINFSDRLLRRGTLVKVQFFLETVPKKSVKNFSHQAAYNNDVTFLYLCLKRVHMKTPRISDFLHRASFFFSLLNIFMKISALYIKINEYDIHSYHA